ncbi:MAG: SAM-dependent methyltransferase, partial [Verrucomicrobia bacterium]|nr:SAM-dependent methyltransferase [Verrucomicrobiota bacterium]
TGSVVVNELIDAFPVHAVQFHDGQWLERYVTTSEHGFDWVLGPPCNPELFEAIGRLPITLGDGYRTEINLECKRWVKAISSKIQKGYILVVDYGFSRHEFYSPERTDGTLRCYFRHKQSHNPLQDPGNRDITAHVEFTSVAEAAEQSGCRVVGYTDQHRFMIGLASEYLRELEAVLQAKGPTPEQSKFIRGYRTLMHPGTMGMAFKYLLLGKGDVSATKSFEFGADPRRALGLEALT